MKYIIISLLILLTSFNAFADGETCKIKGSQDNSSVVLSSSYLEGTTVKGTLGNDSNITSANVSITIKGLYKSGKIETLTKVVNVLALPNRETEFSCSFPATHPNNTSSNFVSYEIVGISGNKCE